MAALPLWLIYALSDLLFVLVYRLLGYRRKVVRQNLARVFPQKTVAERRGIERRFYAYFIDMLLESLKMHGMSPAQILERCQVLTPEVPDGFFDNGQSIIIVTGHYGNTEWAGAAMSLSVKHPLYLTYAPFRNPYLDAWLRRSRERFGSQMVPIDEVLRTLVKHKQEQRCTAMIFSADQMPHPEKVYWMPFLGQETAVYWGVEKIARKFDQPVVFGYARRVGRGRYEIRMEVACAHSAQVPTGYITEAHTRALEQQILHYPDTWYWTHKRWKHHAHQQAYKAYFYQHVCPQNKPPQEVA
jgi:KDO2-lipid IV(A) lauroyltransferase